MPFAENAAARGIQGKDNQPCSFQGDKQQGMLPLGNAIVGIVCQATGSNRRCPCGDRFGDIVLLAEDAFGGGVAVAHHRRPAVVAARFDDVDFVVAIGPVLGAIDDAVVGGQALGIAMAEGPDRAIGEGVIGGDSAVEPEAENFAIGALEVLGGGGVIGIAGGDKERAVGQNQQAAAIVNGRSGDTVEQDAHVGQCCAIVGEADDTLEDLCALAVGVGNKNVWRIGEVGMQGHPEQTAFALFIDVGDLQQRYALTGFGIDAADATDAFGNPEPAVGTPENFPGRIKACGDGASGYCLG